MLSEEYVLLYSIPYKVAGASVMSRQVDHFFFIKIAQLSEGFLVIAEAQLWLANRHRHLSI